jgi:hypothetical protein
MAVNRYDRPVQKDYNMQWYVPQEWTPNFDAWDEVLGQLETEREVALLAADKVPQHHNIDREAVNRYLQEMQGGIDNVTNMYSNQQISQARRAQADMMRSITRDWQPGGRAANFESTYTNIQAYNDHIDTLLEEQVITAPQANWLKSQSLENFGGTYSIDDEGNFLEGSPFSGITAAPYVNILEDALTIADGWKSDKHPDGIAYDSIRGYYDIRTKESVDAEEVFNAIYEPLRDDPKRLASLEQQARVAGATTQEEIQAYINNQVTEAANLAAQKVGFKHIERDFIRDWVAQENMRDRLARQREQENVVAFEYASAGLEVEVPWDASVQGVEEFVQNQEINKSTLARDFLNASNLDPSLNITADDIFNGTWRQKAVISNPELANTNLSNADALNLIGISPGYYNQFVSEMESIQLQQRLAEQQLQDAKAAIEDDFTIRDRIVMNEMADFLDGVDLTGFTDMEGNPVDPMFLRNAMIKGEVEGVYLGDAGGRGAWRLQHQGQEIIIDPDGSRFESIQNQFKFEFDRDARKLAKRYDRRLEEELEQRNTVKTSAWVTSDMPTTNPELIEPVRKGLEQIFSTPPPGIMAYISSGQVDGVTTNEAIPLTDVLSIVGGSAELVNVGTVTNGNITGKRSYEVRYKIEDEDGNVSTLSAYVPVDQVSSPVTDAYWSSPEARAEKALSYLEGYELDSWNIPDLPGLTIRRGEDSNNVNINGEAFTIGEAQGIIEDEYSIRNLMSRIGVGRETAIVLLPYMKAGATPEELLEQIEQLDDE